MRSNEIEVIIRTKGIERGSIEILRVLGEETEALKRTVRECATTIDKLVNLISMNTDVTAKMKDKIEKLERPDDGMHSTRGDL